MNVHSTDSSRPHRSPSGPSRSRILLSLGKELSAVETPTEAARVILEAADVLFPWDAAFVALYLKDEDRIFPVLTFDSIGGERREVPSPYDGTTVSPMSRIVLKEGAQILFRDLDEESTATPTPLYRFGDTVRRSASLMYAPIRKGAESVGILSVQSYRPRAFSRRNLATLQALADHCGGALERTLSAERLRHQERLNRKLAELGRDLSAATSPQEAALVVFNVADELFGWDACYINLYSEENDTVSGVVTIDTLDGRRTIVPPAYEGETPSPLIREVLHRGARLVLRNREETETVEGLTAFGDCQRRSASLMFVPLRRGETNVGVLSIQSYSTGAYRTEDLETLQVLADHVGGALDRTHFQEQLQRREEQLRLLTEQIPTLLWTVDSELKITQILGAHTEILDRNPVDFIGNPISILLSDPDSTESLLRTHHKALQGEASRYEIRIGRQWYDSYVESLRDEEGRIVGCINVAHDITRRKQSEEALQKAREELEQRVEERTHELSNSNLRLKQEMTDRIRLEEKAKEQQEKLIQADKLVALGTLVSGVAHEINNPNNFIMLNTPVILDSWVSIKPVLDRHFEESGDFIVGGLPYSEMRNQIQSLLNGILNGAKRIKTIVQELRDFARKKPDEFTERVQINSVIRSGLLLLDNLVKKSTRRFRVDLHDDLPMIRGHFQRLEQVVINLVQNACQSLPNPDASVRVVSTYDSREEKVVFRVADEGTGIPPEQLKQVLDPFYTTKRDSGGTGLGLSISTSIVQQHGGHLTLESKPGKGTIVTVSLPVHRPKPQGEAAIV